MALEITVAETIEASNVVGQTPSADKSYIILGTDDATGAPELVTDIEAKDALLEALSTETILEDGSSGGWIKDSYDGMWLINYGVESTKNGSLWYGHAEYGFSQRTVVSDIGFDEFTFETVGGTRHITNSLANVSNTAVGDAPDFKGAIGVTSTDVQGVDISIPVFNFTRRLVKASEDVDDDYIADIYALTGSVNNAAWSPYAIGEVLFLGASGVKRGDESGWDLTFRFSVIPNETSITIGDITVAGTIETPAKRGWEYLWIRYADEEDATAKAIVKRPLSVHIEEVYRYEDFTLLGL